MKLSIIVPVFNIDKYIKECLESILPVEKLDWELIVVNDGSSDNSLDIIKKTTASFEKVTVISQNNQGVSSARNAGFAISKGEYILFVDGDDYICKNSLISAVNLIQAQNLDMLLFDFELIPGDTLSQKTAISKNKYYSRDKRLPQQYTCAQKAYCKLHQHDSYLASACQYIVKKDKLVKSNILFSPKIIHEDEPYTINVFLKSNLTSVMYTPLTVYKRRFREGSITRQEASLKSLAGYHIAAIELVKHFFNSSTSFTTKCYLLKHLYKIIRRIAIKVTFVIGKNISKLLQWCLRPIQGH